jgi:hypothetical protein
MDGAGITVKLDALVAVPPAVVTDHEPLAAPLGTVTTICVALLLVTAAVVPFSLTDVALDRLVPVIVTVPPMPPLAGVKLEIVGAGTVTVKFVALVAEPPAVTTVHLPVVALLGTVTTICVAVSLVIDAVAPFNFTDVAFDRLAPVIVTLVPVGPLVGLKPLIVGAGTTVKLDELVAVPPAVVTLQVPLVAPAGTATVIEVDVAVNEGAFVPLSETAVAPERFVPVMVTLVPIPPLEGEKPEIVGAGTVTVKVDELVAVPPAVVTAQAPLVAPKGTVAVICVAESTVYADAAMPFKVTDVAPEKLVPVIVTLVPTGPLVGLKPLIVGAATTVKVAVLVAVPPGVVTLHMPVVAPEGTVTVIDVAELTVNDEALVPFRATAVVPVKFVPVRVTVAPTAPLDGEKFVIAGSTVKLLGLVAVPPAVTTVQVPLVAVAGTVAVICVAELTVYAAVVPFSFTDVAPVRFVPAIVTLAPPVPLLGLTFVIVGVAAVVTVNDELLVAVPPEVVTDQVPVVAPDGTVVVICVAEATVKVALVPLRATAVAPEKFVPVIVTLVPTGPLPGEKLVIVGGWTVVVTVKFVLLVAVPPPVVTAHGPVVAPAGTVAAIVVELVTV